MENKSAGIRWLPGLLTFRQYKPTWLVHDVVAGLVLVTMLVPVGIAYAVASGLPGICGLYATIVPLFAYALFGPSRLAHSAEAVSAVHSTVSFFIASSLQVSRKHNTVPPCRPIKFGRLECGQGRPGGTMSLCYRIASRPMFLSERNCVWLNTLRATPTSPNIHPAFGAARTAFYERLRTVAAFALEAAAVWLDRRPCAWVPPTFRVSNVGRSSTEAGPRQN